MASKDDSTASETYSEAQAQENQASELAAFAFTKRIPQFWRQRPRLWFAQYEAIVASQKMGDEAKYQLVIANLELADIEQVGDIIVSPPAVNKYATLKERLLSTYEESESRQLQKLLGEMELGNQKPSQLLRRMRDLAHDRVPDNTLKIMWTGHLPPSVRAVLAISKETQLDVLASMADKMTEQTQEVQSVCSCQASTSSTSNELLIKKIDALAQEIATLKMEKSGPHTHYRGRYYNHRRNRSRSRSRSSAQRNPICYFHRKFGKDSYRCQKPCEFKKDSEN